MQAFAALNAALKQPLRRPAIAPQRERRAELAALAASNTFAVTRSIDARRVRLTLPEATLAALAAGVALSLEAGPTTTTELWAFAQQTGDRRLKDRAYVAARQHVTSVGQCVAISQSAEAPQGWGQAVAPLLAPPALVALLEATVPPMMWPHLASDSEQTYLAEAELMLNAMTLSQLVDALGPAATTLATRPELQRGVARLLACLLRRLSAARQLLVQESYSVAIREVMHSLNLVACVGGTPAPWAAAVAAHGAAAVVELGATPPPGVADSMYKSVLLEAAFLECSLLKEFLDPLKGAPGVASAPNSRMPRQAGAALGEVVAALMLAADAVLPEPRFKGAERVIQAPLAAAALPWEEEGWTEAPTEFATAAEVCAAVEMTARLLAALPEFIARLPAELQGASREERVGRVAGQLWDGLRIGFKMDLDYSSCAAAAAAADLLASVVKLAGAVENAWPFPGAPQLVKLHLTLMLQGAAALLKRCFLPASSAASAAPPSIELFRAAAIAGVAGLRSALALPSNAADEEPFILIAAAQLTCHALCPDAACARLVARHGGFELLEGLVARVFDPVSGLRSATEQFAGDFQHK
jgi:hypothetical protein